MLASSEDEDGKACATLQSLMMWRMAGAGERILNAIARGKRRVSLARANDCNEEKEWLV